MAHRADLYADDLAPIHNNFINASSFHIKADGIFNVKKENLSATRFLLLDDLGTKISMERLNGFEPSWMIETSPDNFQAGIIFKDPITRAETTVQLQKAIIDAGLSDPGAHGPLTRWARLPCAINGKKKYQNAKGAPFQCKLIKFNPERRYTPEEIVTGLNLILRDIKKANTDKKENPEKSYQMHELFTPKAAENPVITQLKTAGLYKLALDENKHDIICPWVNEHTDALDTGTAYFEPNNRFPMGGFCCMHSHREQYNIGNLCEFLGVDDNEARNKPIIRVVNGELHSITDAVERVFAESNYIYQSGGLLVTIKIDPSTGYVETVPINKDALTKQLSAKIIWEKYDSRTKSMGRVDPPTRHVGVFFNQQEYKHLPILNGISRQPYIREQDGQLVTSSGYDTASKRLGVFDAFKYQFPEPTKETAETALKMLETLLSEFAFQGPQDKAAALCALLTATVRPSLELAPAFHVTAPASGSGKSYLCGLIVQFATPTGSNSTSYPGEAEEATKSMLAALLTSPAVIEFDDMTTDWIPYGTINRMLTSETISDRILGASKIATVSTRSLILGSGNNVGPIRDLSRRVLTIKLDTRSSTPAIIEYKGSPVDEVKANREKYVTAALTIIRAWQASGSPRANIPSIASYNGDWTKYCRHPLVWLGVEDPAAVLIDQVKSDPDGEALSNLMTEWYKEFGSVAVTIRKVLSISDEDAGALYDALLELPIEERGKINRPKLGWLLKKNENRIINGFEFRKGTADGRIAWRVVKVDPLDPNAENVIYSENEHKRMAQKDHIKKLIGEA